MVRRVCAISIHIAKKNSYYGLKSILGKISDSGEGSFLSVLNYMVKKITFIIPFRGL